MSFFRRKSEKVKTSTKTSDGPKESGLHRSSSLRNNYNSNHPQISPKPWNSNNHRDLSIAPGTSETFSIQRPSSLLLSQDALKQLPVISPGSLESPVRTNSQLAKTLQEIIRDKDGLSCFIDFMKSEKAEHLIQFWCDAESFRAATLMRLRSHNLQNVSKSALLKRRADSLHKKDGNQTDDNQEKQTIPFANSADVTVEKFKSGHSNSLVSPGVENCDISVSSVEIIYKDSTSTEEEKFQSPCHSSPKVTVSSGMDSNPAQVPAPNYTTCPVRPTSLSSNNQNLKYLSNSEISGFHPSTASGVKKHPEGVTAINFSKENREKVLTPEDGHNQYSCYKFADANNVNSGLQAAEDMADADGRLSDGEIHNMDKQMPSSQGSFDSDTEDLATKLRKSIERDAVTIFANFIAKDAPKPIGVNDSLRRDAVSQICKEDGQVDPDCFTACQDFALKKIESKYFQSFRDSAYHSKHQINVLTTGIVYLPDILLAENALCYFLEYMEQEGASDLMQLWLAVDNFQQQLLLASDGYDSDQAQSDAMVIYDKYFSLQATQPMGFDDKLRFSVEENICREGGPLPQCFQEAKDIVLRTLDKIYFSSYLQSQVYYRYLSDLVSTVQMAEDFHHKPKSHRRSESDASSELSVGSQSASDTLGASAPKARNTLLAVDTRKGKKPPAATAATAATAAIEGDFSMTMDMFNPDDLWKRTSPGGMSLGCVDQLGQFVSNFEHDSNDKKKAGGFLKRWKDKEKEQEEMALRIAQMIIMDVNSMTQSSESLGSMLEEDGEARSLGDQSLTGEGS